MRWLLLLCAVACGDDAQTRCDDCLDAPLVSGCDVLRQTGCELGERCTWIIDDVTPTHVGHVACAALGSQGDGQACQFNKSGVDNCATGLLCSNYTGQPGTCRAICGFGSEPQCPRSETCTMTDAFLVDGISLAGTCQ